MGFRKARREVPSRTEVQREAREMESTGRALQGKRKQGPHAQSLLWAGGGGCFPPVQTIFLVILKGTPEAAGAASSNWPEAPLSYLMALVSKAGPDLSTPASPQARH